MFERMGVSFPTIILADDHFSHDTPRNSVVDLPVACFPRAREPGFTPSNRRAPQVCRKASKIDRRRPPAVDLSVAPLARLALGVGHRQARNGRSLASCRLSFVLDLEGALRKAKLAQSRQLIGVDLQGHGRTELGDGEFSLVNMGNDMAGVLKKLGYDKVDVLGYSMGGGVAFQFAAQHPEMVRRLTLVSTPYSQDGFYPEMLPQQAAVGAAMAGQMKETPMYKSYVAIAPHPEEFPKLLDAMGAYMRKSYDWSADVKKLTMPVMLIYGDSDMFRPEHEVQFYQLLGGGLKDAGWQREHMSQNRLAILPNLTHYEMGLAPQLVDTALPFLNGQGRAKSWNEQVSAK